MPSISFQAQSHDIDTYYRSENLLRKDCNEFAQLLLHVVSSSRRVSQSILWRRSWIHCTNSPFAALFQLSCFSEILLWAKNLRFHLRLADSDLLQLLSDSVPPVDLQRVGVFRVVCKKHQKEAGESFDFWLNHCITMTESFILTCCGTHTQNIRRWTICTLPRLKSIWLEKINVWNPTSVANFGDISCVFKVGCEELQWLTLQTCNAAFRGWLWRCSMPIWNTPRQLALKTSRPWRLGWIERKPMRIDRCPNFVIGFQTSKSLMSYYLQTWIAPTCWLRVALICNTCSIATSEAKIGMTSTWGAIACTWWMKLHQPYQRLMQNCSSSSPARVMGETRSLTRFLDGDRCSRPRKRNWDGKEW